MNAETTHRLDGLEPDNLLALLALFGLLRALEADDRNRPDADKARPRAAWSVDEPPLRPSLHVQARLSEADISDRAARGLRQLAAAHDFHGRQDLNHSRSECRALLEHKARQAKYDSREAVDVLASLMSDAAIKDDKAEPVDPTPLCLLFGQGHQHFLDRLSAVPRLAAPPPRGKGKTAVEISEMECLAEALFRPVRYDDPTFSFRWDPAEDVRYAMLAGDPTDPAYKSGTQHGANRLAAVGLAALTLSPEVRAGRVRPSIIGGQSGADGFSLAWPIWRGPTTLRTICAMMTHPKLREPRALSHLGVDHVRVARRISTGKFMNFVRARPAA